MREPDELEYKATVYMVRPDPHAPFEHTFKWTVQAGIREHLESGRTGHDIHVAQGTAATEKEAWDDAKHAADLDRTRLAYKQQSRII